MLLTNSQVDENQFSREARNIIRGLLLERLSEERGARIRIVTDLDGGVPKKDIHKIAGPFIDGWTSEFFPGFDGKSFADFKIENVREGGSGSIHDVEFDLSVREMRGRVQIDVKTASLDKGKSAGKGSNLTSYRKIRPYYVSSPRAVFLILAIKHRYYVDQENQLSVGGVQVADTGLEMVGFNIFDLKLVHSDELLFNRRMGDQFQIKDSGSVTEVEDRTTEQFIELIDQKFIQAYDRETWTELAEKYGWVI